jgi:hypothetical protein
LWCHRRDEACPFAHECGPAAQTHLLDLSRDAFLRSLMSMMEQHKEVRGSGRHVLLHKACFPSLHRALATRLTHAVIPTPHSLPTTWNRDSSPSPAPRTSRSFTLCSRSLILGHAPPWHPSGAGSKEPHSRIQLGHASHILVAISKLVVIHCHSHSPFCDLPRLYTSKAACIPHGLSCIHPRGSS